MATLVVLFKLKKGADSNAYEAWAKATDLPVVRGLPSVDRFSVYRIGGLYGSGDPAPYDYVELIDLNDMKQFGADVGTDVMGRVAAEFRQFADNPVFMLTEELK